MWRRRYGSHVGPSRNKWPELALARANGGARQLVRNRDSEAGWHSKFFVWGCGRRPDWPPVEMARLCCQKAPPSDDRLCYGRGTYGQRDGTVRKVPEPWSSIPGEKWEERHDNLLWSLEDWHSLDWMSVQIKDTCLTSPTWPTAFVGGICPQKHLDHLPQISEQEELSACLLSG